MLQGNPYFAWQHVASKDDGRDQAYQPCSHCDQLQQFEDDIFRGVKTVGFYAIRRDNATRWGGLDFDNHGGDLPRGYWQNAAESAFRALSAELPEVWWLECPPGGYHIIGFESGLVPASEMRGRLGRLVPSGVEVFPKQDEVKLDDPRAKGSLLRFPGKHQLRETWARFVERHGRLAGVAVNPIAKSGTWEEPSEQGRLWSLYHVATRGIQITGYGQRYHAMQRIAGRLKGRATESEALWVYTVWHDRHKAFIRTPLEESRAAFVAWFRKAAPCSVAVPEYPLTAAEEAVISSLPKMKDLKPSILAATIKCLLDAKKFADVKGESAFFLSFRQVSNKLGISVSSAANYVSACRYLKLVTLVERGHTGIANTYCLGERWS